MTLVETLFSAVVLVMVLGVFSSLDATSHSTAVNRSPTVAATLAEQELERMRSHSAVRGRVHQRHLLAHLTIASANDIVIAPPGGSSNGDLRTDPGSDAVLGLIAKHNPLRNYH